MNPMQIIQQMNRNNPLFNSPMMSNAMQMLNTNNVKGLQSLAQNVCNQRGINLADVQKEVERRYFGMNRY